MARFTLRTTENVKNKKINNRERECSVLVIGFVPSIPVNLR